MKIIMYGTEICPECVTTKGILETLETVQLDYRNITQSTKLLKEFLAYRDTDKLFLPIIQDGRIGIPFFILEDGTKTFTIHEYIEMEKAQSAPNACSIDGTGQC